MNRHCWTTPIALGASVVLLVACSSTSGGAKGFPAGTYESVASINRSGPVSVNFADDGTLTYQQGDDTFAGTYSVDGDQITVSDSFCKESGQETAIYTWTWDGATLAMTTTPRDGCGARPPVLAAMTPAE
jgi:hypothetical protein